MDGCIGMSNVALNLPFLRRLSLDNCTALAEVRHHHCSIVAMILKAFVSYAGSVACLCYCCFHSRNIYMHCDYV